VYIRCGCIDKQIIGWHWSPYMGQEWGCCCCVEGVKAASLKMGCGILVLPAKAQGKWQMHDLYY